MLGGLALALRPQTVAGQCAADSDVARLPPEPVRELQANVLFSADFPKARIRIAQQFEFGGCNEYLISGSARVKRYHFLRLEAGQVQARVILQFESDLSGREGAYRYAITDPVILGGISFRRNQIFYSAAASAREGPGLEADRTSRFLASRGYRQPDEWMMARFASIPDPRKSHEFIVFYEESLKLSRLTLAQLERGATAVPGLAEIKRAVAERALEVFTILPQAEAGSDARKRNAGLAAEAGWD